jgi:hypothetical protein
MIAFRAFLDACAASLLAAPLLDDDGIGDLRFIFR